VKLKHDLAIKNGRLTFKMAWQRALKFKAIPKYVYSRSERAKILKFYIEAQILNLTQRGSYQVDHIIPLQNPYVCGLHCAANLQVLSKTRNFNKSNAFTCYIEKFGHKTYLKDLSYQYKDHKIARKHNQTKKSAQKLAKKQSKRVGKMLKTVKRKPKTLKNTLKKPKNK